MLHKSDQSVLLRLCPVLFLAINTNCHTCGQKYTGYLCMFTHETTQGVQYIYTCVFENS